MFAYGATCSGKSYTIQGTSSNPGLLPTLVEEILEVAHRTSARGSTSSSECELKISMLEVYQEKIHDLLTEKKERLSIRDINGVVEVARLTSHSIAQSSDIFPLMEVAASKR